jgi:hypothetical protein
VGGPEREEDPLTQEQEPSTRPWGDGVVRSPAVGHDGQVRELLAAGWSIVAEEPSGTWMAKDLNHVLHFLIGLATCGAWWLVWAVLAMRGTRRFVAR